MAFPAWLSQTFPALGGFVGAIVGGLIAWAAQGRLLGKRIQADEDLAERKFKYDRELHDHKRQFELAEILLTDAYRFRALISFARNGISFGSEGESRQNQSESEAVRRLKNSYFIPIERLQKQSEFISNFHSKQYSVQALFGNDISKAYEKFGLAMNAVQVASQMLIETAEWPNNDPILIKKMRCDIWERHATGRPTADEITQYISEAVLQFENLCRPSLEWVSSS